MILIHKRVSNVLICDQRHKYGLWNFLIKALMMVFDDDDDDDYDDDEEEEVVRVVVMVMMMTGHISRTLSAIKTAKPYPDLRLLGTVP